MKIILPTSIILAAIILVIGFFIFNYYENIQIRKGCETIAKNLTAADLPKKIFDKFDEEVNSEMPEYSDWAWNNPSKSVYEYREQYNKILNKKISNYFTSQEERNIEECILENS